MLLAAFLLLSILPGYAVELLWMDALGYASVFWNILGIKALLFVAALVVAAGYLGGNVYVLLRQVPPLWASRWAHEGEPPVVGGRPLTRRRLRNVGFVGAAFLSLLFAAGFAAAWEHFLHYTHSTPYGVADPIFGIDVAFYLLELPFLQALQGRVVGLAFLGLLVVGGGYLLMGEITVHGGRLRVRPSVVRHVGANLILLLLGWAWGFYLNRYALLYGSGEAVYGIGYTDHHVVLPALWVAVVATLGLAVLVALQFRRYRFRLLAYGAGTYVLILLLGLGVVPAVVQQVSVEPNELALEKPYLRYNIRFTREAYRLDEIEERSYPARPTLTAAEVLTNEETIQNIRLWDPRLLIETYRQIQEIRTYYQFYHVDIDRYLIGGEYREVMLSARGLAPELPGRTDSWLNRHLVYTHGYGAVMNRVAEKDEEGTPILLLKDLPPETPFPNLRVEQPAIYYGEGAPTYSIVDTRAEELHYPKGDDNVYIHYEGTGGVALDSFWRRLLFAWVFSDYNIILSDYLTDESQIQFWNQVQERIRLITPFLALDHDPYFVLADNRQYWIQDAYTTAEYFPYAEPLRRGRFRGVNYMRNSAKIVVDAYSGDVTFYVVNPDDPLLAAYRAAFPDLFEPLSAMSEDLRRHLRYPRDLFAAQVEKFARYHMTVPRVFYNNEDLWARPREQYGSEQIIMEPYYILTRLPDEEELQFLLMTPYTPARRDNMIAWLAAKSDIPAYGELIVYELPKQQLIYGPNQVEARIDQDPEISEQLSLWNRSGSNVIRGNLIVVPIEESFLYVEPVFLIASGIEIPQLRRVIVAYGERVAMEPTLEQALSAVLGVAVTEPSDRGEAVPAVLPSPVQVEQLEEAREVLERAQEALRAGDFSSFGAAFEAPQRVLEETAAPPVAPDTTGAVQ